MSSILKGIKQLNEVNPHNYDSDWDYQNAVASSGRPRFRSSDSYDAHDAENDAYEMHKRFAATRARKEAEAKAAAEKAKTGEQGMAEGLSKRDQQDVAAIRAAIERLQAQLSQPGADQAAIQASIAHEKKRLALYKQGVAEGDEYKSRHAHKQEQDKAYNDYRTKHATSSLALMTRAEFAKDQRERAAKKKQGVAEAGYPEVDHMPGPTIKRTQTGCKRCHGKGHVYKTPDGEVHPMNRPDAKKYKCGKCDGIGFVKTEGVAEGKEEKIAQLKKDHATAVHWSKNETSPQKREAARQKAEKIKRHLETQYKQGVAEEQLDELSPQTLASYKKKAGADATAADKRGDYDRGNKRMSGIMQATRKEFDNDAKGVEEENQRLDPSCWTGYKKQGTKMKGGVRVNNCVPVSESAILQGLKKL